MPNRLAQSTSPYLRQHQDNPVDWHEWGVEAFEEAVARDVPILLSVGYSACHWCHVMAHESFEDPVTAALMNDLFVNVKVDREERPDVDAVYMEAVQAMSGHGGWPMTVWLTPEGLPFYAGTYFPKEPRGGMASFSTVLQAISEAWTDRRDDVAEQANRLTEAMNQAIPPGSALPGPEVLRAAYETLLDSHDPVNGGFGGAPKFPQQPALEFLLRLTAQPWAEDASRILTETLVKMARGGIYDQVGGGFARYSVDASWLVPHFEKMLYDNAQLARLYVWAWRELGIDEFRTIAEETLAYLRTDMRHPDGGFYSAEDADSEGEEGRFYVWTLDEFTAAVDEDDLEVALAHFGVTSTGNFEGSNILHVARTSTEIAASTGAEPDRVRGHIASARSALARARSNRVRPGLDYKIVASWNGLMIRTLAEAGAVLDTPDLVDDARSCARFVLAEMTTADHRVMRSWAEGEAKVEGFLEDYAATGLGLLSLYQVTGETEWFESAERILAHIPQRFADTAGGFFTVAADAEQLIKRPKDQFDNPLPSGNSMAAEALLWLSLLTGRGDLSNLVDATITAGSLILERYPSGAGHLAAVLASIQRGTREVAVVGPRHTEFSKQFWSRYRPHAVIAVSAHGGAGIPLLEGRDVEDGTFAYVCEGFACNQPVDDPGAMSDQL